MTKVWYYNKPEIYLGSVFYLPYMMYKHPAIQISTLYNLKLKLQQAFLSPTDTMSPSRKTILAICKPENSN